MKRFTRSTKKSTNKVRKQLLLSPQDVAKVEIVANDYGISFGEAMRKIIKKVDIENV